MESGRNTRTYNIREGGGLMVDDKAKGEKVDRFGELYGLKTMDYSGYTRCNPYKPSATTNDESGI